MHVHLCMRIPIHMHTYTRAYLYTCIPIHMHTYTHTAGLWTVAPACSRGSIYDATPPLLDVLYDGEGSGRFVDGRPGATLCSHWEGLADPESSIASVALQLLEVVGTATSAEEGAILIADFAILEWDGGNGTWCMPL